jgi:hypothetical protein
MAPKHHPAPFSGGDRKALKKELGKARAMTTILAAQAEETRAKGEALIKQADRLLCESWNERMWADGEPIDPSPDRRPGDQRPTAIAQFVFNSLESKNPAVAGGVCCLLLK